MVHVEARFETHGQYRYSRLLQVKGVICSHPPTGRLSSALRRLPPMEFRHDHRWSPDRIRPKGFQPDRASAVISHRNGRPVKCYSGTVSLDLLEKRTVFSDAGRRQGAIEEYMTLGEVSRVHQGANPG
jgi:hypothetical protein